MKKIEEKDSIEFDIKNIAKGDILELQFIDNPSEVRKEKVTEIENPIEDDPYFSIRTENIDFDIFNFWKIIGIEKAKK